MTVQEQAVTYGAKYMDTNTLLYLCLGVNDAQKFLMITENMKNMDCSMSAFRSTMSPVKATQAFALMELIRRGVPEKNTKERITSSRDIYDFLKPSMDSLSVEHFYAVFLNRANKVISTTMISAGGFSNTVVDVKVLMLQALQARASSIIIAHNHPSGETKPSQADIEITKKIKSACDVMEMYLLDHVIFGDDKYFSFADEGLIL